MAAAPIVLTGAPDIHMSRKKVGNKPAVQAIQVQLADEIVKELLQSSKAGKQPQLYLGNVPTLRYGDKSHTLNLTDNKFRTELYRSDSVGSKKDLTFAALIKHRLAQEQEDTTAEADVALQTWKRSRDAVEQEKAASKTQIEEGLMRTVKKGNRKFLQSPAVRTPVRSLVSSPVQSTLPSPAMPPRSVGLGQKADQKAAAIAAVRKGIVHLLALEPCTFEVLCNKVAPKHPGSLITDKDVKDILPKVAKLTTDHKYQLLDRAYKGIDVFAFAYSASDREKIINNAIRAFDRQRLPKTDPNWQYLLPKDERGQGKCLSRLNLKANVDQSAPKPTAASLPKFAKLGEKKKVPVKKTASKDEEEAKKSPMAKGGASRKVVAKDKKDGATPAAKSAVKELKHTVKPTANATKASAGKNNQGMPKSSDARPTRPTENAPATATAERKMLKSAAGVKKPQGTKPKTPSPLSASLNASDLEDSHPVHKALSASTSPVKWSQGNSDRHLKRKANDLDENVHNHGATMKRAKAEPPKTSVLSKKANTPSSQYGHQKMVNGAHAAPKGLATNVRGLKRGASDMDVSTLKSAKHRKVEPGLTAGTPRSTIAPVSRNPSSPIQSDSSTDQAHQKHQAHEEQVPFAARQTLDLAGRFNVHYANYVKFHLQLASSPTPPSEQERTELMRKRQKLEEMKQVINQGAKAMK